MIREVVKRMKTTFFIFAIVFASLFFINSTTSVANLATGEYDPWLDLNDDGKINIFDVVMVASAYSTSGKPFNKTAALLELQAQVSVLDATISARLPQVDFLSIPAAAFASEGEPPLNGERYNDGGFISMLSSDYILTSGYFYAPVQLPSGVTIKRLTSYWWDEGSDYVACDLFRRCMHASVSFKLISSLANACPVVMRAHFGGLDYSA